MSEFWSMSGYGAYVWSCYALTFIVMLWNAISARRALQRQKQRAKRRIAAQAGQS